MLEPIIAVYKQAKRLFHNTPDETVSEIYNKKSTERGGYLLMMKKGF